ncbi:cobalamin B12-binding domain-containing protein [Qipengyuania qiaonensis]|uniref:Cobalamin B12-binding domain-containing protein n=1 Tax=Qipengyuania qiaonensis TaxID=2867240 RepID=A0ABS7JBU4_9SPHN|nr:cobalamin B12-binding domain-containing protein [Qipengyuania qiaonensis]MBX7483529.1 cobalamin B12-binding domain-containing protein [Qipengyuania qiaonensis]
MASAIGMGSAALLKAISSPLKGWMRTQDVQADRLEGNSGQQLGTVIEGDFIPRLMMRYSHGTSSPTTDRQPVVESEEANRFALLPLQLEADELLVEVETFLHRGVSVEAIFLNLLAPSARQIGRLWEDDECDFVDVTMGLWRLQEVMREIAARSPPIVRSIGKPRSALFAPLPGDQHSFGALIVDEIFARSGWDSEALIDPERRELLRLISEKPYDLVGLTITSDCNSGALSKLISAIRTVSANPQTRVLIGGRAVNENPGLLAEAGADGTAVDAEAALKLANRLVESARLSA